MSSSLHDRHLDDAQLRQWLASERLPTVAVASHLAGCAACRARIAADDPSALLGLLGVLPSVLEIPPPPRWVLPARPQRSRWARPLLAAAAALLATVVLFTLQEAADPVPRNARTLRQPPTVQVRRVYTPNARVVTLVPAGTGAPPVALIVGDGIDL